jgi:hypothetical protein
LIRVGNTFTDEPIDAGHQVLVVRLAIAGDDFAQELAAATGRATWVRQQHRIATLRHELSPVVPVGEELHVPGSTRTTVDVQQRWVASALFVANWQDQQPLDLEPVERGPAYLAGLAEVVVAHPRVQIGQPAGFTTDVSHPDIRQRGGITARERDA